MAKKKGSGEVDDDLNLDDLEGLDEGLDLGDLDDVGNDRNPSAAGIAKELSKEAASGFLDSLVKQTAKKSLPPEYEYHYSDAMEYADLGKELYTTGKNRIEKSMFKLGNEVKKILPFQSKMLDNFLEKYKEENERAREISEEQQRDAGIQSNLASIFDKQLEVQSALEARRSAKEEVKDKQSLVTTRLNLNLLNSIDSNIAQSTAFTLQISKEYYRKSLELQYKTYFVQADMLKTLKDYYKGFSVQFDNIVKNTGLPEYVKLTNSERIGEMARDKIAQTAYKKLFVESEYAQKVRARANNYISSKLDEKLSGIDSFSDSLGMLTSAGEGSGGMLRLLGGVGAGMAGTVLGEKRGNKIATKIREKVKDNKVINAGGNMLSTLAQSPVAFFANLRRMISKKQEEYEGENTPGQWLGNKLLGGVNDFLSVTNPDSMNYEVKKDSILDHSKPALYTNKTDRAITETIPMYLAKILLQNTKLTSMYGQVNVGKFKLNPKENEELVYNYEERKLSTKAEFVSSVENSVLKKRGAKERTEGIASSMLSNAKSNLSKDKKANKDDINALDKKANKLLTEYLVKANNKGVSLDYKTLFEDATDPNKANSVVKDMIKENPQLLKVLQAVKKGSDSRTVRLVDGDLSDVNRRYPIAGVKELFRQASRIARAGVETSIDDNTAEVIAKAFVDYQMKENPGVVLPDLVLSGSAFKYLNKDLMTNDFKRAIGIFTSDVKRILISGGIDATSALDFYFAAMDKSLRSGFETDPKSFQTLIDYSPDLGQYGKLNAENLIEGKLFRTSEEDKNYVSMADLKSITRVSKVTIDQNRKDLFSGIMESRLVKMGSDFRKDISEAGTNPLKLLDVTMKHIKIANSEIKTKVKEYYKEAGDKLKDLEDQFKDLSEKTAGKAVVALQTTLKNYSNSLTNLIEADKIALEEKLKTLNELKSAASEVTSDGRSLGQIDREIKLVTAYHNDKVKVLEEIKKTIQSQQERIKSIEENMQGKSATDLFKEVKEAVSSGLEKLTKLMEKAKAVDEKAETTAT